MDVCGREKRDAAVEVVLVVPGEKLREERACVHQRTEAPRHFRPVLEGLERGLGEGVVVGDARAAVARGDSEVGVQEGGGLCGHRRAAVRVDGELSRLDAVALARVLDDSAP